MDLKDINKLNFNLEIKITEEQKKKLAGVLFRNARLFFLIFIGAVTIYSFDIVFKKAYVDITYIQYPVNMTALGEGAAKTKLDEILKAMERRKQDVEAMKDKQYANPFSYREKDVPKAEADGDKKTDAEKEVLQDDAALP